MSKNDIEQLIDCNWMSTYAGEDLPPTYYKAIINDEGFEAGSVDMEWNEVGPWVIQFWGDVKWLQPHFDQLSFDRCAGVQFIKKEIDEFLIRILKLKAFL